MYYALGIVVFLGLFYFLGKYERKRRALFFENVMKIFQIEKEIEINERTKLLINKEKSFGHFAKHSISVVFEDVIVEKRSFTENLNSDETISFKGPWKNDIYNVLKHKYNFYTTHEKQLDNVVKLKSRKELYAERYKRYIASRENAYN